MIISNSAGAKIIYPDTQITAIEPSLRLKQTGITFLKTAGFTLLSVFIPVLHFILVPLGLLLTVFLTYSTFKKNYVAKNLEVHCPSCDKKSAQNLFSKELPLRTYCPHCRQLVYLDNDYTAKH